MSKQQKNSYEIQVLNRIQNIMIHKDMTQTDLARLTKIPQATISKLINGKAKMTLTYISQICQALKIDPSTITSFDKITFDNLESMYDQIYDIKNATHADVFIQNTDLPAFKGYLGKYYLYVNSTISSELNLLEGIFTVYSTDTNGNCGVSLELHTGMTSESGQAITKKYSGQMIISIPMSTCYVMMSNPEIGEMVFFAFHHMFCFNRSMACRMAVGISTSSGENRRPVAQRFLISRRKLDTKELFSEDTQFLQGQLRLNSSDIIISKKEFDSLLNSDLISDAPDIKEFLHECRSSFELQEFYHAEEAKLRTLRASSTAKLKGLSYLRNHSVATKYNKISTKSDEYTYAYINSPTF